MVSCGMSFIKYLLFLFNLLFAISGIVILAVGATIVARQKNLQLVVDHFWSAAVLLIAVGSIVFLISFLGCCGAVRNSNVMVMSFAVLLIIIFILELTAAVAGYLLQSKIHDVLQTSLNESLKSYDNTTTVREAWNIMQHDFKCCGVNGPDDWQTVFKNTTLPDFCCPDKDVKDKCILNGPIPYNKEGCLMKFEKIFHDKGFLVVGIGLGVCFIQIAGVILSCCLGRALRKDYETV
ncbi:CD63 antigen-like [Thrips palmi]|uniref:Tetraspanin n=1 Tax=Thrips palmi TaxID=161013 RepID=A0A6P9A3A1_THRPL|nr:CD63 antigen-like [Thrips palmi]